MRIAGALKPDLRFVAAGVLLSLSTQLDETVVGSRDSRLGQRRWRVRHPGDGGAGRRLGSFGGPLHALGFEVHVAVGQPFVQGDDWDEEAAHVER